MPASLASLALPMTPCCERVERARQAQLALLWSVHLQEGTSAEEVVNIDFSEHRHSDCTPTGFSTFFALPKEFVLCFWSPEIQQSSHHIIPEKGPIHKSPVNQCMSPSRPPDLYCGVGLLLSERERTDKSTILPTGTRGRDANQPL